LDASRRGAHIQTKKKTKDKVSLPELFFFFLACALCLGQISTEREEVPNTMQRNQYRTCQRVLLVSFKKKRVLLVEFIANRKIDTVLFSSVRRS
jgi:hypothetical protein